MWNLICSMFTPCPWKGLGIEINPNHSRNKILDCVNKISWSLGTKPCPPLRFADGAWNKTPQLRQILAEKSSWFWGCFFLFFFSLSLLCLAPPKPLNATQAFGPNLRYIVRWRRRDPRGSWHNETVRSARHVVWNTPIYVPYEIKVQAENDFGRAPEPDTYIGYSGEDCEYCLRCRWGFEG